MKKITLSFIISLFAFSLFAATHIITVQNFAFSPSSLTVNYGDSIKWVWVNGTHTTTSTNIPMTAASWDKPISSSAQSFSYFASKTGFYQYQCTPHAPNMAGSFTVVCPPVSGQIGASGPTTFCSGGSVTLNVFSSGNLAQWKKNGVAIAGATSPSYTAKTTGSYSVTVSNTCGSSFTTNSIQVTVNPLPGAIITPGDTVFICSGDSIKLLTNSNMSLTYQWRKNGVDISGATAKKYFAKSTGNYKVTVTKTPTGCKKLSEATRVVVNCREGFIDQNASLTIYPSPSNNEFNLMIPDINSGNYKAVLYDSKGVQLKHIPVDGGKAIFGSDLQGGFYFIAVYKDGKIAARKKIIKTN